MIENSIMYLVETKVEEKNLPTLKELISKMVAQTEKEEGALAYHWSIKGDTVFTIEHYRDNAATKLHLDGFSKNFAEDYMNLVTVTACTVYGNPNAEVKEILDGFGSVYRDTIEGFVK
ncbi:hypothetical protein JG537_03600 [Streptococcus sp. SL1232]|uniref:putative quinol monooxygenase n=1 Tax=Streptococcus vicugnae TaxID=2740579 RepID=UPI0018F4E239|nr:hypothetical protein [Streptococcus vicugnae]MBJ7540802.1 hypothetical protein [Streptococcus vicugnae]